MNNGTELIINKALTGFLETVGQVKDFTVEQVPEVLQQMLVYEFISACIWISFYCILIISITYGSYKFIKFIIKKELIELSPLVLISLFLLVFILVGLGNDIGKAVKIKVAPKLYILDYAKRILSN